MHYHWISQQGNERRINNDAALFIEREQYYFAMIVDAAQKGQPSRAFTQFILNHMASGIVEISSYCQLSYSACTQVGNRP